MNNKFRFAVRKFEPFERTMQKIWDSYCAQTGCELEAEFVPMDLPELHQSIITDGGLKNGNWDAAHIVTDWLLEAHQSGALENIREQQSETYFSAWSNSLLEMQQFGNAVVGLPFHDGPECLIYRKDLFASEEEQRKFKELHGKDLKLPETWEDFIQIAEFFQRPEQNLYGTVVAAYPDGHNTVFDFCLQLWTRGGSLTDNQGKININTTEAFEALKFYKSLLKDKSAIHPQSAEYESVKSGQAFANGEVAMMINWFGFAAVCEVSEDSKVKGKVDVAALPKANGEESASLNVYWLYAIGAGSQHKELAYDFISYATNAQNDKLLTLEGGIGCRKSTWADSEINQIIPYYHKLDMLHKNARTLPQKENWSEIATAIDEMVMSSLGDEDLRTIIKLTQKKIDELEDK